MLTGGDTNTKNVRKEKFVPLQDVLVQKLLVRHVQRVDRQLNGVTLNLIINGGKHHKAPKVTQELANIPAIVRLRVHHIKVVLQPVVVAVGQANGVQVLVQVIQMLVKRNNSL